MCCNQQVEDGYEAAKLANYEGWIERSTMFKGKYKQYLVLDGPAETLQTYADDSMKKPSLMLRFDQIQYVSQLPRNEILLRDPQRKKILTFWPGSSRDTKEWMKYLSMVTSRRGKPVSPAP